MRSRNSSKSALSEDIAERLHVLLFPADADHVASSLDDEQPLQRESFDFLQHVFARQAKQLPVFVGQQSVVTDAGKVQFVGQVSGHGWRNTERQDAAERTQTALKHSVVGAASGQIGGDT